MKPNINRNINLLKVDHEILNKPGQQVKIQLTLKGHPVSTTYGCLFFLYWKKDIHIKYTDTLRWIDSYSRERLMIKI